MKVGFLSISNRTVDQREAKMALFDSGHALGPMISVSEKDEIEWALAQLRPVCDVIVIEGVTDEFYKLYSDRLSAHTESFDIDGKLFCVTPAATSAFLLDKFVPLLNSTHKNKKQFQVVVFKTFNKSEAELKTLLKDFTKQRSKVQIGFFPAFMECEVHVRVSTSMPKADFNEIMNKIMPILYKYTYALERVTIAERVAQMLIDLGLKLKIAESFTGGALAQAFTSLPGASKYLVEDIVSYSISSKINRLGLSAQSIAEKGVVSKDTAYQMAVGLINSGNCDIAISTTGNAGPSAVSGAVGECILAIGDRQEVHVMRYMFDGDLEDNIKRGVKTALFILYNYLEMLEASRQKKGGQPE
ncbi:MAG: CinA family protein [Clostridiales bacterium]|nr:CinA family protein [Clostridiales bacterium]